MADSSPSSLSQGRRFSVPALLLHVVLFGSALTCVVLYWAHQGAQFSTAGPRGALADMPYENRGAGARHRAKKGRVRTLTAANAETADAIQREAKKAEKETGPMNVVLFYADDWRHDTLGAAGNPIVKTPVLDALAAEGVRFTENCVTTSICWVSRATLLSGQYLARHKFEMLGEGRTVVTNGKEVKMGFEVPQNETLYALLKHQAGYSVGHAGKLGLWVEFDEANYDFMEDEDGWHWDRRGHKRWHITEKNTADALRFLGERDRGKPFFLNVAYFATHAVDGDRRQYLPQDASMALYENDTIPIPATATEEAWSRMPPFFGEDNEGRTRWRWRFDTPAKHQHMMKNYYRMASEVDTSVGTVLKYLEREGQLDNTLVIFTTDNGNFHAEHGLADKWYPHQESIRVPLIIKDPRMAPEFVGTTNDDFTLNVDLTATILAAAGLDPLPSMMGRDVSVLYRDGGPRRAAARTGGARRHLAAAADGGGRYHPGSADAWRTEFFYEHPMHSSPQFIPASEALVRKDYKYFYWPDFKYEQLFDLKSDPGEMHDLFHSTNPAHRRKLKDMRQRFGELKKLAHSDAPIIL